MSTETKGARLKALRLNRGLTQEEVGKRIRVTKQTLYKYENDIISNIPSDKIELLALIYNVTPAYILGWAGPLQDTPPPDSATEAARAFLSILLQGKPEAQAVIAKAKINVNGQLEIPDVDVKDTVLINAYLDNLRQALHKAVKEDNGLNRVDLTPVFKQQ